MRIWSTILLCALALCTITGADAPIIVTSQVLDYDKGFLFFTTGDGFRVSPQVVVVDGPVRTRSYVRVTFDPSGTVTRIEVSRTPLPQQGLYLPLHKFVVALSSPVPNPDLLVKKTTGYCGDVKPGKIVSLSVTVEVPPTTSLTDSIYMTSDTSAWNPQAYPLDRIDALHYRATLKVYSGTIMHVLFDRGSTQSVQVGENGIEQQPYLLCIGDEDAQAFTRTVYRWQDDSGSGSLPIPQTMPTPYNPAPFPNLPSPRP